MHNEAEKRAKGEAVARFNQVRADAINMYAAVEQSLATLFARLLESDIQKSFLVFSNMQSSQKRLDTLSVLLEMDYEGQYTVFFKSLRGRLIELTGKRDRIVHWMLKTSTTGGQEFNPETDVALHAHPDIFDQKRMLRPELEQFYDQADFYRLLVFNFGVYLSNPDDRNIGHPDKKPWSEIFKEKVKYPPPKDHQLRR